MYNLFETGEKILQIILDGPLGELYANNSYNLLIAADTYFGDFVSREKSRGYKRSKYPKKFWPMLSKINTSNFDAKSFWKDDKKKTSENKCETKRNKQPVLEESLEIFISYIFL